MAEEETKTTLTKELPEGFKMTELGPLPNEWQVVPLGEVGRVITGRTPPTSNSEYWNGSIPFITPVDLRGSSIYTAQRTITNEGLRNAKALPRGAVLVSCIGYIGKIGVVDIEIAATNQQINAIIPQKAENWFLAFALMHEIKLLESRARMTTVPILHKTNFQRVLIPLPPLDEQRAISHVLRTVQRAKEATEQVIAALKEFKKSLMRHLFTYGPVPIEQADKVELKDTEIGPVPAHWEVKKLGDVAKVMYGKAKPTNMRGNIPVIGSGGIYSWTTEPLINFATLIIGRKGTAGQVWLCELPCWPSDTTFYLKWKSLEILDVRFIYGWFLFNPLSGEHAKTTIPSLQRPDLENYPIPFPSLDEQKKIAEILISLDNKIKAEENKKSALETLFKTLLHNLMTGKIRVSNVE